MTSPTVPLAETWPPALDRIGARVAPLSFAQQRLWFIDFAAGGSATYNVPLLLRWREPAQIGALRTALAAVVARHEVLRSTYELRDGQPVQVVRDPAPVTVETVDVSELTGAPGVRGVPGLEARAAHDAARRARVPFDLSRQPPVQCTVWSGLPGGDAVLLNIHHIAIDGWSLAVLLGDLAEAYEAALAGQCPSLAELPIQYGDFAVWERSMFADAALQRQLKDRAAELLSLSPGLRLAGYRQATGPHPDGAARPGDQQVFEIPGQIWQGVQSLAATLRVTPFVVFLAAFQAVVRRRCGRDQFLLGTVTANRPHPTLEALVGFFVNTVPLRCHVVTGWTFRELCVRARGEAYRTLTHQRLPFDQLIAEVNAARAAAGGAERSVLVDVAFAFQNMPPAPARRSVRWAAPVQLPTGTAKFDLLLIIEEGPHGPFGTVEYDTDRYPAEVALGMGEDLLALLRAAVDDPDRRLCELLPPKTGAAETADHTAGPAAAGERSAAAVAALDGTAEERAAELFRDVLARLAGGVPDRGHFGPAADFFALGGHSLLAVTMLAEAQRRYGVTVSPRDFLADPTVGGLARLLRGRAGAPSTVVSDGAGTGAARYLATSAQQRFLFLDKIPALRQAYLVPSLMELSGAVDHTALRRAVTEVLGRHPALRSRFELDRKARQVFYRTDGAPPQVTIHNGQSWSPGELAERLAAACWTPFDLAREAPCRAGILVLADRTLVVLCAHHMVIDGWSQRVLTDQITQVYRAAVAGRKAVLPDPVHPAALADPGGADVAEVVSRLRDVPTDVRLPGFRPRGGMQSVRGGTCAAVLDRATTAGLRATAAALGGTIFMASAALLAAALARAGDQRDFAFAFPWAGRQTPAGTDAVGMFVNTLLLRVDLRGEPTWREALGRVRTDATAAFRHADVAFDAVAAALHGGRDLSRPPVTPVFLTTVDGVPEPLDFGPGLGARLLPLDRPPVKYELELTVADRAEDLLMTAAYAADLCDEQAVAGLLAALAAAAADLIADPDSRVVKET